MARNLRCDSAMPPAPAASPALWVLAIVLVCFLGLLGCGREGVRPAEPGSSPGTDAAARASEIVLAIIADHPATAIAELGDLVTWLETELAQADSPMAVRVRVARTVPEVAGWMRRGEADFFFDTPHPILLARHASGCRPILRRWKYGEPSYRSVIFTRADAPLDSLDDLADHIVAFEDRYSSSSFFLPLTTLRAAGLEGELLAEADRSPAPGSAGYVFSGGDSTTMHWVRAGKVDAGAMNEWNFERLSSADRDGVRILATTPEVPRYLVAARADLAPSVETAVRELLLAADQTEKGRAMLEAFSETARFDPVPGDFLEQLDALQAEVVALDRWVEEATAPLGGDANEASFHSEASSRSEAGLAAPSEAGSSAEGAPAGG